MTAIPLQTAKRHRQLPVRRAFVDGKFGQIHIRTAGERQTGRAPLLCLHMFPQSSRGLAAFAAAMGEHTEVIAIDTPGYGESSAPPADATATDYASAVWDVADGLSLTSVDLFGIHAGSKLAVAATCQRPDVVGRLVLSSAAAMTDSEVNALRRAFSPLPLDTEGTRYQRLWESLVTQCDHSKGLGVLAETFAEIVRRPDGTERGHFAVFDYNARFASDIASLSQPIALINPGDGLYDKTPRTLQHAQSAVLIDRPQWPLNYLEIVPDDVAALCRQFLYQDTTTPLAGQGIR
ncbi:MAG: alpha/beta hydrolase [Pseudomonadota bacterium]